MLSLPFWVFGVLFFIFILSGFLIGWFVEWRIDLGYWRTYFQEAKQEDEKASMMVLQGAAKTLELPAAGQEFVIETLRDQMSQRDADLTTLRGTIDQFNALEARWRERETELIEEAKRYRAKMDELEEARKDADEEWRHELARREQQWQESKEGELNKMRAEVEVAKQHVAAEAPAAAEAHRQALAKLQSELVTKYTNELETLRTQHAQAQTELTALQAQFTQYKARYPETLANVINGIGPKLEEDLRRAGIYTYADLAGRTPEELNAILNPPKWRKLDFADWIEQAQRLSERETAN